MQNQQRQRRQRQENTLEAQIQPGDTLQAIALRYNCTVSVVLFLLQQQQQSRKTHKQEQRAMQSYILEINILVGKRTHTHTITRAQ